MRLLTIIQYQCCKIYWTLDNSRSNSKGLGKREIWFNFGELTSIKRIIHVRIGTDILQIQVHNYKKVRIIGIQIIQSSTANFLVQNR